MSQKLSDSERVDLIRKGNALFNDGKIEEAKKCFLNANYGDGLIRVGDHYFYELKKPAVALLLYRHAGHTKKVREITDSIVAVIRTLLSEDTTRRFERAFPPARENTDNWQESGASHPLPAKRANPVFDSFMAKYGDKIAAAGKPVQDTPDGSPPREASSFGTRDDAGPMFPPGSLGAKIQGASASGTPPNRTPREEHASAFGSPPRETSSFGTRDDAGPMFPPGSLGAKIQGASASGTPPNRTPREERASAFGSPPRETPSSRARDDAELLFPPGSLGAKLRGTQSAQGASASIIRKAQNDVKEQDGGAEEPTRGIGANPALVAFLSKLAGAEKAKQGAGGNQESGGPQ